VIKYIWSKIFKKIRGCSLKNSRIDKTSKIEAGSNIVNVEMDKYSFCGYDCEITNCTIGKFSSIADRVIIGGAFHPMEWVSMSPVFYAGRDSVKKKFSEFKKAETKKTQIGHDVWIGNYVLIKQGVTIGTGAVIGMGSVVTKDVPPYEIWAGNPARCIRKRFDDELAQRLLASAWWDLDESILQEAAKFVKEPKAFLDYIEKAELGVGDVGGNILNSNI